MSDDKIQKFMELTNSSISVAQQYLNDYKEIDTAVNAFYADRLDNESNKANSPFMNPETNNLTNVRPELGGNRGANESFGSSRSSSTSQFGGLGQRNTNSISSRGGSLTNSNSNSRFMSFSDMVRGKADKEEDEHKQRTTFAGGETSGLEIADPNPSERNPSSLLRDLLEKAKRGGQQLANGGFSDEEGTGFGVDDNEDEKVESFAGKGYRLGSSLDAQDQIIEDNGNTSTGKPKKVTREITFWKDGFQVGDSKLYRYDDPSNSFYLSELNQGRAPLKLLDVEFGQEVNVNVFKKLDEEYKPPKRQLGGFSGEGQRLGSPVPGDSKVKLINTQSSNLANEASKPDEKKKEDEKKYDIAIQIRYSNGKKELYRCNSSDTVESLYDYVEDNTDDNRTFTLNTSFPVKPIAKDSTTLKVANLANSVVVQRWV
ncbi:hypothetical protein TBLA_0C05150 [Henningerozyma blattae CBS 6284]|uniref:UBX domain-containing protein n=1 Tax=Henningerozyma blattae (strain ATCC 34711 / CBS 6284 / DSM 70876 / NBRC 10599 / NRRL Y-10934 / UCD 77-7) TaxID=1071380 RepID=I2H1Q9_HENB6|nr:hypothetical protein TBLA_0C05150 [Tetrapisispora blattae CBS 6284]CCH60311.1 hypothetical protein TBLA_0C05150 [Tetrapisispora blattae CBS 6284]